MTPFERAAIKLARDALDVEAAQREDWLRQQCGEDAALTARVHALLRQIELDGDAATCAPDDADPLLGASLGPFRVLQRIGRGGMGVVYRGERVGEDFRQQVALKLIRRGFDFDDIRARFLRERRILARLDHPNLARFIDGGVGNDGRPWFALEYVQGTPITRWCDEHRLGLRARMRLLLQVCAAVQYAHAQLVVHRDLKPGNILVDAAGHVHLLDFGIARLLGDDDAGDAATTLAQRSVLTPGYAAPEQFGGAAAGVATDVYALGVVAYELVAGALPHVVAAHDLAAAAKVLREQPPSSLTQALARDGQALAQQRLQARDTSLAAFRRSVRGDLARILDTALAAEPARRYPSVQALADDLKRWLAGEPVQVSGTAMGYRLRKFVARNRLALALGLVALVALVGGLGATLWQMREARIQRNDALAAARRADAVRDYLMLLLGDASAQKDASRVDVREVFHRGAQRLRDEFRDQPEAGQTAALMLSDLFLQVADLDGASALLEQLLQWPGIEANPTVLAHARYNLAQIEMNRGHAQRAGELLRQAQAWWHGQPGAAAVLLNESRSTQARLERAQGHPEQAIATLRSAVAERARLLARPDFESGNLLNALAIALLQDGDYEQAQARASDSHAVFVALGRADSDGALAALNSRCNAAVMLGQHESCLEDYRLIADKTRALYGEGPKLAAALHNLGAVLTRVGRYEEALPILVQARDIATAQTGPRSPLTVTLMVALAELQALRGEAATGLGLADTAIAIASADYAANKNLLGAAYRARAQAQRAAGHMAAARADVAQAGALFAQTGRSGAAYARQLEPLRAAVAEP